MRTVEAVERGTFLTNLSEGAVDRLMEAGRVRSHPVGSMLFLQGDDSHGVQIILSGTVKLTVLTLDGREVVLELRGPGEILGEMSAVDGEPRSATATVIEEAEVLTIGLAAFQEQFAKDAEIAAEMLRSVTQRLREASMRQLELGTSDALARVCSRLAELADRHGEPEGDAVQVDSPISQEDLAEWAGLSRDAVVKALKTMRGLGWIETGRRSITIHDLEAVRQRGEI